MSRLTGADDPMLGCLLLLNRALQRPVPAAVLLEGLPLEGRGLTLPLLCAAATRAGLSTRLVERDLDDIPDTSLPAILLLGKNRPCVLLQRCEHGRFLVALPGWDGGVQEVSREELLAQDRGHAIFALPALQPGVSTDTELVQPCPSPGAVLRQSWLRHCERLLASSLRSLCQCRRHPAEEVARAGG
ncbi:cysteine peptidase family C39 domain-containing protein [Cupriavidus necator]